MLRLINRVFIMMKSIMIFGAITIRCDSLPLLLVHCLMGLPTTSKHPLHASTTCHMLHSHHVHVVLLLPPGQVVPFWTDPRSCCADT